VYKILAGSVGIVLLAGLDFEGSARAHFLVKRSAEVLHQYRWKGGVATLPLPAMGNLQTKRADRSADYPLLAVLNFIIYATLLLHFSNDIELFW